MENNSGTALAEKTTSEASISPVRFEDGTEMTLAGYRQPYTYDTLQEIPAQWARFVPHMDTVPARVGKVDYGVVLEAPGEKRFDYMTAFEVSDTSQLPEGFATLEVPAQRYAVFEHPGPVNTMCETIDGIFNRWLPASGREVTGLPDLLERYGENFNPELGAGDIEIWVPIKD